MLHYGEKTLLWVLLAVGIPIAVLLATGQISNATSLGIMILFAVGAIALAMLYEKYDTVRLIEPMYTGYGVVNVRGI